MKSLLLARPVVSVPFNSQKTEIQYSAVPKVDSCKEMSHRHPTEFYTTTRSLGFPPPWTLPSVSGTSTSGSGSIYKHQCTWNYMGFSSVSLWRKCKLAVPCIETRAKQKHRKHNQHSETHTVNYSVLIMESYRFTTGMYLWNLFLRCRGKTFSFNQSTERWVVSRH